jgi:hypothetical protein
MGALEGVNNLNFYFSFPTNNNKSVNFKIGNDEKNSQISSDLLELIKSYAKSKPGNSNQQLLDLVGSKDFKEVSGFIDSYLSNSIDNPVQLRSLLTNLRESKNLNEFLGKILNNNPDDYNNKVLEDAINKLYLKDLLKSLNNDYINFAHQVLGSNASSEFKDILTKAMVNGISDNEKQIINLLLNSNESEMATLAYQSVFAQNDAPVELQASLYAGLPSDEYLEKMKLAEELDFKIRELKKFYKKMDTISGNLPMGEMVSDVLGTNTKLSNVHETDIGRLNDIKVQSIVFA